MSNGSDAASNLMSEAVSKVMKPLAVLTGIIKKSVQSIWEQVLASRSEELVWSTTRRDVHDSNCDIIALIGETADIIGRMSSPVAGGCMPVVQDHITFTTLATSLRKYTASVMAADRIFSQVRALKTKTSRNDNYRGCPCLLFRCCLFVFAACRPLCLLSVARLVMSQATNAM